MSWTCWSACGHMGLEAPAPPTQAPREAAPDQSVLKLLSREVLYEPARTPTRRSAFGTVTWGDVFGKKYVALAVDPARHPEELKLNAPELPPAAPDASTTTTSNKASHQVRLLACRGCHLVPPPTPRARACPPATSRMNRESGAYSPAADAPQVADL